MIERDKGPCALQSMGAAPRDGTKVILHTEEGAVSCCWDDLAQTWAASWLGVSIAESDAIGWMPMSHATAENRPDTVPAITIQPMGLSGGRTDYFVSIRVGDREVTPHVFREEYKAAYHVALYSWLLNGAPEPDPLEFDEGDWPAQRVGPGYIPPELLERTFAVQHSPRCVSPWLIRLPGQSGVIDMKPYGDITGLVKHQTGDQLGFGNTFAEAAAKALSSGRKWKDAD